MTDRPTILVVEDDEALAEMAVEHLQATVDAKVIRTAGATETIRLVTDNPPDLMLVDLLLPDGNGLDLIRTIRARDEYPKFRLDNNNGTQTTFHKLDLGVGVSVLSEMLSGSKRLRMLRTSVRDSGEAQEDAKAHEEYLATAAKRAKTQTTGLRQIS